MKKEIEDRMLHLEEGNEEDSDEYAQLEMVLKCKVPKPRYPVTEQLVTVYYRDLELVRKQLKKADYEILKYTANVCSHWLFVRGIPNVIAHMEGVITVAWRTEDENDRLIASFENQQ